MTLPQLQELLREAAGQQVDVDAPLMDTGISSRAALKLMGDLQRLADHLVSTSGQIASLLSDLDNRPASMRSQPLAAGEAYTSINEEPPLPQARLGPS